jgi:hypothetical protein
MFTRSSYITIDNNNKKKQSFTRKKIKQREVLKMNEFMENKISEAELNEVTGGVGEAGVKVRPINPIWVRVTASSLNCRYTPNGEIAKVYEKGHKLKVDGITADGEWYRLLIYDPKGGTCYAYIFKKYTEKI